MTLKYSADGSVSNKERKKIVRNLRVVKTSATERRTEVQAEVRSTEEAQRKARVSELG